MKRVLRWMLLTFLLLDKFRQDSRAWLFAKLPVPALRAKLPKWETKAEIDAGAAIEALRWIDEVARDCGARAYVISGTLLGLHRDGRLLAHDYDLDLGIDADDPAMERFVQALKSSPRVSRFETVSFGKLTTTLNPWLGVLPRREILHVAHINDPARPQAPPVRTDVFVHFAAFGYAAHGSAKSLWLNRPFSLERRRFAAGAFLVPAETERYLEENYGDFRIVRKDFNSALDCPNAVNVYSTTGAAYVNRLVAKARRHEFRAGELGALAAERFSDFKTYLSGDNDLRPAWKIRRTE